MKNTQNHPIKKSNGVFQYFKIGIKPGKIPELDGLRACAILMVLLYHFISTYQDAYGSYYRKIFSELVQRSFHNGWLGVDLFFVLSGYLIFNHLLKTQTQPNKFKSYGNYAMKRVLRTFPLYYAIIVLYVLIIAPAFTSHLSFFDYFIHLVFLQDYFGANILAPLWSLATEEKFYLLAPFLVLFLNRLSAKKSIIYLLVFMTTITVVKSFIIYQNGEALNYGMYFLKYRAPFHFAIVSIGVGIVVALMAQMQPHRLLPIAGLLSSVMVVLILCFVDFFNPEVWYWTNLYHYFTILLFGVWVLTAVKFTGSRWMRFLRGRFLRQIAVLSYALYLSHMAVLPWVFKLQRSWVTSEEPWIHGSSYFVIFIGSSVVLSLLLHYVVEKPFLIIKDKL